jgi:NAD(P)-dependent dehydrogenase (short-subunit alcohol dehydrogenase family)
MPVAIVTGAAQGIGRTIASLEGPNLATAADILVNNAGIGNSKPVHLTSDEEFDRFVSVNFRSVFRFTREALGVMASGASSFVNGHVLVIDGGWSAANYVAS